MLQKIFSCVSTENRNGTKESRTMSNSKNSIEINQNDYCSVGQYNQIHSTYQQNTNTPNPWNKHNGGQQRKVTSKSTNHLADHNKTSQIDRTIPTKTQQPLNDTQRINSSQSRSKKTHYVNEQRDAICKSSQQLIKDNMGTPRNRTPPSKSQQSVSDTQQIHFSQTWKLDSNGTYNDTSHYQFISDVDIGRDLPKEPKQQKSYTRDSYDVQLTHPNEGKLQTFIQPNRVTSQKSNTLSTVSHSSVCNTNKQMQDYRNRNSHLYNTGNQKPFPAKNMTTEQAHQKYYRGNQNNYIRRNSAPFVHNMQEAFNPNYDQYVYDHTQQCGNIQYHRSNSDSNILEDFMPRPVGNHYQQSSRRTLRSIKRKKQRRKTYSSVEDMLDWDMHTDTSDIELFPEDEQYVGKHSINRQFSVPGYFSDSSAQFADSVFDDEEDRNNNKTEWTSGPYQEKIDGYVTDVDSPNYNQQISFHEYQPPWRRSGHHFNGYIKADSMFSVRNVGRSRDRLSSGLYDSKSSLRHYQPHKERYRDSQDLSDVLIDKEDLHVMKQLCSGKNFAVYSAHLKIRSREYSPYLSAVCVQIFQGLNNNADRINFLQNVAELRQLKHRHILEVIGVCIGGKNRLIDESSNPEMIIVTECTHHQVNLQNLLVWCDDYNPQLLTEYCIVTFAIEICCGLMYLVSQGILHNNLTTSTIMIDNNCVIKLSGLEPHNIKQRCAPYRWVAIENHEGKVTSASTIWSLGVVLWSMKTLGEKPYHHLKTAGEIYNYLIQGKRLDKPSSCNDTLYKWMLACWRHNPKERPQITQLMEFLEYYKGTLSEFKTPNNLFPNEQSFWT